ncbi:MAG: hypothetical protein EOL88_09590 [Bacteroidia bacterium]|nr:hypothetical protein [Bacteroidia bacterium]
MEHRCRLFRFLVFLLVLQALSVQAQVEVQYLSNEEQALANAVNQWRRQNDLPEVPLSNALTYVADVHAKDLHFYTPYDRNCSMHSWSDNGRWSGCCYSNPTTDGRCMHNKPHELTGYAGLGFELVYWDNSAHPSENAFQLWKANHASNTLLLNRDLFSVYDWNAMGVRIFRGYVVLWFGTVQDVSRPQVTEAGDTLMSSDSTGRMALTDSLPVNDRQMYFYVVVASYASEKEAVGDKPRWEKRFFEPLKVISGNGKYRLAVGAFEDMKTAEGVLQRIKHEVKDAWIINTTLP